MSLLDSLLFPNYAAQDTRRYERERGMTGAPARGSDLSLYLSNAGEAQRQSTLGGISGGIGSLIQMLAYMKGRGMLGGQQPAAAQTQDPYAAAWGPGASSAPMGPAPAPYEQGYYFNNTSSQIRPGDMDRLRAIIAAMQAQPRSYGGR